MNNDAGGESSGHNEALDQTADEDRTTDMTLEDEADWLLFSQAYRNWDRLEPLDAYVIRKGRPANHKLLAPDAEGYEGLGGHVASSQGRPLKIDEIRDSDAVNEVEYIGPGESPAGLVARDAAWLRQPQPNLDRRSESPVGDFTGIKASNRGAAAAPNHAQRRRGRSVAEGPSTRRRRLFSRRIPNRSIHPSNLEWNLEQRSYFEEGGSRARSAIVVIAAIAALTVLVSFGVRAITGESPDIAARVPSSSTASPPSNDIQANIEKPTSDLTVDSPVVVTGTAKIPGDQRIWLLVSPPSLGGPGFAVDGPISVSASGRWRTSVLLGKDCRDEGKNYEIFLVSAPRGGVIDRKTKGKHLSANYESVGQIGTIPGDTVILEHRQLVLAKFRRHVIVDNGC